MKSTTQPAANVLIVEDDQPYADKFIAPHFEVDWRVKIAYNVPQGLAALKTITDLRLAIVDLDLPGGSQPTQESGGAGFEVIEAINEKFPRARVVVLTAHLTTKLVNRAQDLNAEYVSKSDCNNNVSKIAHELWQTKLRPGPEPSTKIVASIAEATSLSDRQAEVLLLLVNGHSRQEVGTKLRLSHWTVKAHVGAILHKTGAERTQELILSIRKRAS